MAKLTQRKFGKAKQTIRPAVPLTAISLFSGAGGMDIGFEEAGFDVRVAVEFDPSCCATLRCNRPDRPVIEGDISKVEVQEILKVARLKPLQASVVFGGPPCQSFSLAGKRLGMDDPRGKLVLEFIRIVRGTLPVAFVMENVKGMMNWNGGAAMEAIEEELKLDVSFEGKKYHYEVSHGVLNAADFGVPQTRERVFIVGNRIGVTFQFPAPTHGAIANQRTLFDSRKPHLGVWDAIGRLPPATEPSETAKRIARTIKARRLKHGY